MPTTGATPPVPAEKTRVVTVALSLLTLVGVSGCSAYDLPLPGGAGTGDNSYTVTAEFADVLDLVPQSSVKVNQVTVGSVEDIQVTGWTATVRLRLPGNVVLPDNATAELKQTSLLGEKYVALAAPTDAPPQGRLGRGRPHPAVAHQPQPRGRGGPRRDVAAAQRWWRRPAEDHRGRAQQRAPWPHRSTSRTSSRS